MGKIQPIFSSSFLLNVRTIKAGRRSLMGAFGPFGVEIVERPLQGNAHAIQFLRVDEVNWEIQSARKEFKRKFVYRRPNPFARSHSES